MKVKVVLRKVIAGLGRTLLCALLITACSSSDDNTPSNTSTASAGAPVRLSISGPTTFEASSTCRSYIVSLLDSSGTSATSSSPTTVDLSGAGFGAFFSDNCTTVTNSVVIPAGISSVVFFYRNQTPENVTLLAQDDAGSIASASLGVSITGPTQLALSGPTVTGAGVCTTYFVQANDSSGQLTNVSNAVTVNLSGQASGNFYSDSTCSTVSANPVIASGSSFAAFYYQNNTQESVTFTAADAAGNLSSVNLGVVVDGATKLVVTGDTTLSVGECSSYIVSAQNASNNSIPVNADVTVNLSGQGTGFFYSDAACSAMVGSVTVSSGSSFSQFYYQNASLENVTLTATDASAILTAGTLGVNVGGAGRLFIDGPTNVAQGACNAFSIRTQDSSGQAANVSADVLVNLTPNTDTFFSDNACTTGIATATVSAGTSSVEVWVKRDTGGGAFITLMAADNAAVLSPFSRNLFVENPVVAVLSISDGPLFFDFGNIQNGTTSTKEFTVTNTSTVGATGMAEGSSVLAAPFAFTTGSYPGGTGTDFCGTTLAAGQTCKVSVTFSPTTNGSFSSVLSIMHASGEATRQVIGTGSATGSTGVAGTLDTTFDTDGLVQTDLGDDDRGYAVKTQSDGKIVVSGTTLNPTFDDYDMAVVRYNTNGSLDTTFGGGDGIVEVDVDNGSNDYALDVAIQADGKIVAAGFSSSSTGNRISVARFTAAGVLDSTFGTSGVVVTSIGSSGDDEAYSVAIQGDGKIVVAGADGNQLAVVRYNTDGSYDTSFGGTGVQLLNVFAGAFHVANSVLVQTDGKILVGGYATNATVSSSQFLLARFNTNGTLDASFGGAGVILTTLASSYDVVSDMALYSDGRIMAVGYSFNPGTGFYDFILARYFSNGTLDNSFDGNGVQRTQLLSLGHNYAEAVAIQSDEKIVVGGRYTRVGSTDNRFLVARYTTSGALDTTFSGDGFADIGNGQGFDVTLQSDGKIILVGTNGDQFGVARYNN